MTAPAPGTVLLDKYRVERVLGQGGMGVVVAAQHLHLGERVAIKMLLPEIAGNPDIVARFMREAQAAVRLKGEHVARVIDVGMLPWGAPYMVMEHLEGVDLEKVLQQGPLQPAIAIDYVMQACEALAEAHALGIVHRDIKPANFFITRRPDGSPLLKVLDFGISKAPIGQATSLTQTNAVMGTPAYMSPEQLRGARDVDARTDLWSLGVVLFEAVGGWRPFGADTFSGLAIQVATEPTPRLRVQLPHGLDAIIYRTLEKNPNQRFSSVAELAAALAPYAGNRRQAETIVERASAILRVSTNAMRAPTPTPVPVSAQTVHTTLGASAAAMQTAPPAPRKRGALIAGIAGVVVAVVVIAIVATRGGDSANEAKPAAAPVVTPAPPPAPVATPPPAPAPAPPPPAPAPVVTPPPPAPAPTPPAPAPKPKQQVKKPTQTPKPATGSATGSNGSAAPPPPNGPLDNRM